MKTKKQLRYLKKNDSILACIGAGMLLIVTFCFYAWRWEAAVACLTFVLFAILFRICLYLDAAEFDRDIELEEKENAA